ncbi:hypothetical protein DPMN_071337 [Dreissena polymorpha]|uniref:Uncharacterized protein n=1 Tax=Dreissena polymorpha TaxID=45954 RepID=A0A9D4BVP4_DREPO|nr:hypothetical protein DPMN_071337 [Dreissena polymorpha]
MIGERYALATLILNMLKRSLAGSWPTRNKKKKKKDEMKTIICRIARFRLRSAWFRLDPNFFQIFRLDLDDRHKVAAP